MLTLPISVDIAIFRVANGTLQTLLVQRDAATSAYPGQWSLPGGVVETGDPDLLHAVHRTLRRRIGGDLGYVEQVSTHANATRDPRGWSVTTLYFALVAPHEQVNDTEHQMWVSIDDPKTRALAFDHSALLQEAVTRLRNKSVYSLLPGYWEKKDPAMFKELYAESWQEKYDRADDYEYIAQGHANVWVIEMGSKAENGSFEAFMDGFAGKKVCGDTHNLIYQSPSQGEITFGWNRPLTVGGETICIHGYKRYDNEFAQTEFDAGAIEINAGGHQTILDFEKAERTDI